MSGLKRPSLTLQLLTGIAVPFLLVILLIGIIAYLSAQDEISEVYDSQLITSAQQLSIIAAKDYDPSDVKLGGIDPHLAATDQAALDDYARWRLFRVWREGALVLGSKTGPKDMAATYPNGFSTQKTAKGTWRIFTLRIPENQMVVSVGESLSARREVSVRVVWGVCLPLLMVLPVIVLMVWLGIRYGLKDLTRFAGEVRQRSPDDLSRVGSTGLPVEIAPLGEAVNQLMTKLERSLAQERLFTDNAAHELRTPLAALVVQSDVLRNATSETERGQLLDELSQGVHRAARLLDQLLFLARIRHTPAPLAPLNLHQASASAIGDLYVKAQSKDITLSLSGIEDAFVTTNRELLGILIGNILDNAIKYAPASSPVDLHVAREANAVVLTVRDRGPGIAPDERERVFARFYRLKGVNAGGSGLGLAIVRTLADILAVDVTLHTPTDDQGLCVRIEFPD